MCCSPRKQSVKLEQTVWRRKIIDSNQELKSKVEKGNIISDSSALRRCIRGYKQFYVYTFENLDGMGKFLEKKNNPKRTQEVTENWNNPVTIKEIETTI